MAVMRKMYDATVYDHIDQITWIRMATWVDGEGCITILSSGKPHGSAFQDIRVNVSQSDLRLMRWLTERFGGSYHASKGKSRKCYNWMVGGVRAEALIKGIKPYLIIKGEQADLALAYRATIGNRATRALDKETLELRESIKQELFRIKRNPPDQEMVQ